MPHKKMNNIEEATVKKMAVYLIMVAVLFISIILIFVIYLRVSTNKDEFYNFSMDYYNDIMMHDFKEITLTNEAYDLSKVCDGGCYLKINNNNQMYYFFVSQDEEDYVMYIYNESEKLDEIFIGNDISALRANYYNGAIVFGLIYNDEIDNNDIIIIVTDDNVEVVNSVGINEIELSELGIVYYSYACMQNEDTNAIKNKNIRTVNSSIPIVVEQEYFNYNKC